MHEEHVGRGAQQQHRREIPLRVEAHIGDQRGVRRMRVEDEHEALVRQAPRGPPAPCRASPRRRRDLDDHRHAQLGRQRALEQARDGVHAAAGRKGCHGCGSARWARGGLGQGGGGQQASPGATQHAACDHPVSSVMLVIMPAGAGFRQRPAATSWQPGCCPPVICRSAGMTPRLIALLVLWPALAMAQAPTPPMAGGPSAPERQRTGHRAQGVHRGTDGSAARRRAWAAKPRPWPATLARRSAVHRRPAVRPDARYRVTGAAARDITPRQRSISLWICARNSSGELPIGGPPIFNRCADISSASAAVAA